MVKPSDLGGDESLARRVLAYVRTFAPCIATLDPDTEDGKTAVVILQAVVAEVKARGHRGVKSQATGSSRVEYVVDAGTFSLDDRDALRALCGAQAGSGGGPVGSFPRERPVGRVWGETY